MSRLDHLVERARGTSVDFGAERASRVFAGTVAKREKRIARDRVVRRGVVGLAVAAFIGFVLLRGASANAPGTQATAVPTSEPIAVHASADPSSNDGGYARD